MTFRHNTGNVVRYAGHDWIVTARYEDSTPEYITRFDRSPWYQLERRVSTGAADVWTLYTAMAQESQLQAPFEPTCTASRGDMLRAWQAVVAEHEAPAISFQVGDKVRRQYRADGPIGLMRWTILCIDATHAWMKGDTGTRTTAKLSDLVHEPNREIQVGDKVRVCGFNKGYKVVAAFMDKLWVFDDSGLHATLRRNKCELVP